MKAARIHRYGGALQLDEIPAPSPGPDDLLVQVKAASLNPVDHKIRDGGIKALIKYPMPLTMGNDLSGVVKAVGKNVRRFQPGDEIFARLDKDRIGAWAEEALVRESVAARKPTNLSHVEAASIPLVGLTAWQVLVEIGGLTAGQKVLIHAGSGGVGTFAIQLAKHLGATVSTTAGARNAERLRQLGADRVIDYQSERFDELLRDQDVVFDTQGGETLLRSFSVVKRGGVVVTVGGKPDAAFAREWGMNRFFVLVLGLLARPITRAARAAGARFQYLFMRADGEQLTRIAELLQAGTLRPIIDKTFPLAGAAEALAYVESGRVTGKVVLEI